MVFSTTFPRRLQLKFCNKEIAIIKTALTTVARSLWLIKNMSYPRVYLLLFSQKANPTCFYHTAVSERFDEKRYLILLNNSAVLQINTRVNRKYGIIGKSVAIVLSFLYYFHSLVAN